MSIGMFPESISGIVTRALVNMPSSVFDDAMNILRPYMYGEYNEAQARARIAKIEGEEKSYYQNSELTRLSEINEARIDDLMDRISELELKISKNTDSGASGAAAPTDKGDGE
jgi:hypothetical protein